MSLHDTSASKGDATPLEDLVIADLLRYKPQFMIYPEASLLHCVSGVANHLK